METVSPKPRPAINSRPPEPSGWVARACAKLRSGNTDKYFAFADQVMVSATRVLTAVCVARAAGVEAFAGYYLLVNVDVIVSLILVSFVARPLNILLVDKDPEAGRKFLSGCVHGAIGFSVICVAACGVIALLVDPGLGGAIAAFGFFLGFSLPYHILRRTALALFKGKRLFLADCAATALVLAGLAFGILYGLMSPAYVFQVLGFGCVLASIVLLMDMKWLTVARRGAIQEAARAIWPIGRFSCGGSIANSVCSRVHPYMLTIIAGSEAVALFGAVLTLVGPMRMLSSGIEAVLMPRFKLHLKRDGAERARQTLRKALLGLGVFSVCCCLPLMLLPEWILSLVFGEAYAAAGTPLRIAGVYAIVLAVVTLLVAVAQCLSQERKVFRNRVAAVVLTAVIAWPLMAWKGTTGAILALLVVESIYLLRLLPLISFSERARTHGEMEHVSRETINHAGDHRHPHVPAAREPAATAG